MENANTQQDIFRCQIENCGNIKVPSNSPTKIQSMNSQQPPALTRFLFPQSSSVFFSLLQSSSVFLSLPPSLELYPLISISLNLQTPLDMKAPLCRTQSTQCCLQGKISHYLVVVISSTACGGNYSQAGISYKCVRKNEKKKFFIHRRLLPESNRPV